MRLVLFHLETTLVDRAEGFRRWAWEFCAEHRLTREDADWLSTADDHGRANRAVFFKEVHDRFGLRHNETELLEAYRERHPALIPAAPGVLTGLPRLRAAGWRIGVLGESDYHLSTLLCTGIAGLVDGWALAGTEGVSTSDTRLLGIAAGRCEAPMEGGWLVAGAGRSADFGGGASAGPGADPSASRTSGGGVSSDSPSAGKASGGGVSSDDPSAGKASDGGVSSDGPSTGRAVHGEVSSDRPSAERTSGWVSSDCLSAGRAAGLHTVWVGPRTEEVVDRAVPDTAAAIGLLLG
ncbi:HAD family hydrolase [Amycolatopsis jejuensis]|uniref:HAD family hydrolase n=1 Tax=Amycolatopsis jejuensis TaxID=330084 RepID=UPI00068FE3E1|nr:hypothetical protein [Amycolatopsis jejuensis]